MDSRFWLKLAAQNLFQSNPIPTARLAFLLGVRQRQVQYWLSGHQEAPEDVFPVIEEQIKAVHAFGLRERIDDLISQAKMAGVHPQVVGHYFTVAGDTLKEMGSNSSSSRV